MIVNRFITKYKEGKFEEGLTLMKNETKRLLEKSGYGELRRTRLFIPLDQDNTLIGEYEFDDMAQKGRFWESWNADPVVPAFIEKHASLHGGEMASGDFELLVDDHFQK